MITKVPPEGTEKSLGRNGVNWLLVGALASILAIFGTAGVFLIAKITAETSIDVVNRANVQLRLNHCVEDSLDVRPGGRKSFSIPAGERYACGVYEDGVYQGCLVLDGNLKDGAVKFLREDVDKGVDEQRCLNL